MENGPFTSSSTSERKREGESAITGSPSCNQPGEASGSSWLKEGRDRFESQLRGYERWRFPDGRSLNELGQENPYRER